MDHKLYLKDPGIFKNKNFYYTSGKLVTDSVTLKRLNKLKPPPAWTSVWYASNKDCHIQVYGTDTSGKKQYILSENYINESRSEKYKNMKNFTRNLESFKRKIKLKNEIINRENLIYLLFNLLIDTHIRVGNEIYAETNKTYGLTTLRQKHLKFENGSFNFTFIGKSKIKHTILVPPEYNNFMQKLQLSHKNKLLFWYRDPEMKYITSDDLNNFLKDNMGKDYTCKDFRTYSANVLFIKYFLKNSKGKFNVKKIILKSIDETAYQLGHTRSISRKSYISNNLIDYCLDSFESAASCSAKELLCKVWSV